jgi:NAD(P)-dependent dehydrogenase (short-subunit alcohol dehydrogenase family)
VDLVFDGDVAVITGAGRGIGRAHALELARRGARVVVNDLPGDPSPAQEVVAEIRAAGGEAVANTDTVTTAAGGAAIVEQAVDTFGRIDIVVNNAGIVRDAMFHKLTTDQFDDVLAVHLAGAVHVTTPAWRHLRAQGYGRVVNTTSASGLFGNPGQANYGAAKAAVYGLTRVLALEGKRSGIQVNAVAPAAATRMNAEMLGERAGWLDPAAIAPVVAFLAHRSCELTGQVLAAGGGHVAAILVSVTSGITESELTAESVRDRIDAVLDPAGATVPRHIGDDLKQLFAALEGVRAR